MVESTTMLLLMDLYGSTLSKAKFDDLYSYYSEDLSLSEIAANKNKSRQAVFNSVRCAENALLKLENELGFLKKIENLKSDFSKIEETVKSIKSALGDESNDKVSRYLDGILKITGKYISD